jgi:hypothetical protein
MTTSYVDELIANLKGMDISDVYNGKRFDVDTKRVLEAPLELDADEPPQLLLDGTTSANQDGRNAILVHRYLGQMTAQQAAERRLWVYLTHVDFFEYTHKRWPGTRGANKVAHIENRYFFRPGRQALNGNSIARLWWGAYLTYAPWQRDSYFASLEKEHSDEYELTRMLFAKQNIFQGVMLRRFGSSDRVRICFLEALRRNALTFANMTDLSEQVEQRINLVCSYRELTALPFERLLEFMKKQVVLVMGGLTKVVA